MRIKIILPVTSVEIFQKTKEEVKKWIRSDFCIDVEKNEYGTPSIESRYDEALCIPDLLRIAIKAESEGYDGVIISCMFDTGLYACREKLRIPVVAPARTLLLYASELASSFAVLTPLQSSVNIIRSIVNDLNLNSKLAYIKQLHIPVLELSREDVLLDSLTKNAIDAIENYNADSIILGCTGIIGLSGKLQKNLLKVGHNVPILDPLSISIKYLESLISLSLSHSKNSYIPPRKKKDNVLDLFDTKS